MNFNNFNLISFNRFNYHLEKVRELVNNAFTGLLSFDTDEAFENMEVDEFNNSLEKSLTDNVDPNDRIMCKIVDEIKFSP